MNMASNFRNVPMKAFVTTVFRDQVNPSQWEI